jgi:hypothetical protein
LEWMWNPVSHIKGKTQKNNIWTKRDEIRGGWRKTYNVQHFSLYSPTVIRTIKSRRMRLVENISWMAKMRHAHIIL